MLLLLLLVHLLLACVVKAHVALTFPQARFPPLDFLDTARTVAPCGVPRPGSPRYTELYVNEPYNFTWRLQYPHQGGYRISVINETGDILEQLAPVQGNEYDGLDDQTAQYATVRPTRRCTHCIILLERQALEWGNAYGFRSCADVNIVQRVPNDSERCSMHGDYENGKCRCRHSYSGTRCQYKDYCSTDEDCLNDGKCVKESNTVVPRTCYCAFGYFGQNCDRTFDAKPENDKCFNYNYPQDEDSFNKYGLFNENCFKKSELNADDVVYSRVVHDELEVILDYKGTSWISIGWRPMEIDRSCRLFPDLENSRHKRSATARAVISEPEGTLPGNTSIYHNMVTGGIPEIDFDLMPVPMPKLPKNNGLLKAALLAPLHPMDCTDIVIGSVRDGRSRINDMYTRDRSTPLHDTWLDGEESFSAAYGIERDGRTIIMFRRRIAEIEPSDHPLGPGKIFVIYAKGQTTGHHSHAVKSALEQGEIKDHDFYKRDQVKYHGNRNRGVYPIEFVSEDERPPSIRPPLRFRQQDSSSSLSSSTALHQPSEKHESIIQGPPPSSSATTAVAVSPVPVPAPPPHIQSSATNGTLSPTSKSHSGLLQKAAAPTPENRFKTKSKSKPQPEPELNIHELDYLYFDNGSFSAVQSRFRLIIVFYIPTSIFLTLFRLNL